jgi:flagellar biosynthesis/type III secretory pathway chaperone
MDIAAKQKYISAVKEQCSLFGELFRTMEKEKDVLVKNSTAGLMDVLGNKEALIGSIAGQEKIKAVCLAEMAASLRVPGSANAKLSDVLVAAAEKDSLEIEEAVEALVKLLEKISGANAGNVRMVKNFLNFAGFTKKLRESLASPKQITYSADGGKEFGESDGKKLDFKI